MVRKKREKNHPGPRGEKGPRYRGKGEETGCFNPESSRIKHLGLPTSQTKRKDHEKEKRGIHYPQPLRVGDRYCPSRREAGTSFFTSPLGLIVKERERTWEGKEGG